MGKTSIKNYTIAGLIGSLVVAIFIWGFILADVNYDITGINSSSLSAYGNFTEMAEEINSTTSEVTELNADRTLFDVIGDLIVEGLGAIKSFISGITFMKEAITNMMGSGVIYIPDVIIVAIITIITLSLASVLLFKYISGKDDEL